MLFDRITIDESGNYKRASITIAMVGEMRVPIYWASNAMGIVLPINSSRQLYTYPHPSTDIARNLAVAAWLKERKERAMIGQAAAATSHLFLWTSGSYIAWNAINETVQSGRPAMQIGDTYCFTKDAIDPEGAPWFRDGKWRGRECYQADGLKSSDRQFIGPAMPDKIEILDKENLVTSDQLFVTCVPSLGHTSLIWTSYMLQMAAPVATCKLLSIMVRREVADARTMLVEAVLKMNPRPKYLVFIGDDNLMPPAGLQLIFETMRMRGASACSGLYMMKYHPPVQPLLWRNGRGGWMVPGVDFQMGDAVECDGTGLDATIIKTEVFDKMPRPWFKTGMEKAENGGITIHTEDAHFWHKFQKCTGEKVLVDTRCRVGHYDSQSGRVF